MVFRHEVNDTSSQGKMLNVAAGSFLIRSAQEELRSRLNFRYSLKI